MKLLLYFKMPGVIDEALANEQRRRRKKGEPAMPAAECNDWYERCSRIVKGYEDLKITVDSNGYYEVVL